MGEPSHFDTHGLSLSRGQTWTLLGYKQLGLRCLNNVHNVHSKKQVLSVI